MNDRRSTEAFEKAWLAFCGERASAHAVSFAAGWEAAREAAAKIAEDWDNRGDPGVAMYAASRIRDRIKWLLKVGDQ